MKNINFFNHSSIKANKSLALFIIFLFTGFLSEAQLQADFSASPVAGCAPLVTNFTDASTGDPSSWLWDLGNGTTSTLKNPAAIYSTPGTYTVKLTIENSDGTNSITKEAFITVYSSPEISIGGSPLSGCFPLKTQFTDESLPGSGTMAKWEWDFGDGNISDLQNPAHVYKATGNFNVSLRGTNSYGCATSVTSTSYVNINTGVKAEFSNSIPNSCSAPAIINFTNTSTGTGSLNYKWDFGDGSTSDLPDPSHAYASSGSYTVTLIVNSSIGCTDTLIKSHLITIGAIHADFTDPGTVCKGAPVTLQNTSFPAPGYILWDFGDGTFSDSTNPMKIYEDPGTYTIKMIANFGACVDSLSKEIKVQSGPVVGFSSSPTFSCSAPLTVNFTNSTTGGSTYLWDFGDGNTSTSGDVSNTYLKEGLYTLKLFATNAAGCQDSIIKPDLIKIKSAVDSLIGLPLGGCGPLTHTFKVKVDPEQKIVSYHWDFGDGTTSTEAAPEHTYTDLGKYTVTLTYTTAAGCTETITVVDGVSVGSKPKANFSADILNACAFQKITFTNLSTGDPNKFLWLFGDGNSSVLQNPENVYRDTGYFTVKLIAFNNGCADSMTLPNYVYIKPPVAIFNNKTTCALPERVVFTDISINADSWKWEFGDGILSDLQNPVHDYAPGTYVVKLTVTNESTGCYFSKTRTLHIIKEVAAFTSSDSAICKNAPVIFTAIGNDRKNIGYYTWRFGDGHSIQTGKNTITHTYAEPGVYDVTLIARDINGCENSIKKINAIKVSGPTASFSSSNLAVCSNSAVNFIDSSYSTVGESIIKWDWNWGDGDSTTFTSGPFTHVYATAGIYTVSLKVTDSNGCEDSISKPNAILVSKPITDFAGDSASCTAAPVNFINASAGVGLVYAWNFGDGGTSNKKDPAHLYTTEGLFSVSLAIKDTYGCVDSISRIDYVKIANPEADFTLKDSTVNCPPLIANFTNTSKNFTTSAWDFGDGATSTARNPSHFYSAVGTFTAVLTVSGPGGCTSKKSMKIVINGPSTSFSYTNIIGCKPLETTFKVRTGPNINVIWDFDDGTSLKAPNSVITHTYKNAGTYLPKMILADTSGCSVLLTGEDSIKVIDVTASFKNSGIIVCDSGLVQFSNTSISNDLIANYYWNFGDGTTSTQENPLHGYTQQGVYNTTLRVVTQEGCRDRVSNPANVKVILSPKISITGDAGACVPAVLNFKGNIVSPDTSAITWNWNFANGNTSTLINPPDQNYSTVGKYTVKAIASNSSGCRDTASKMIEVYALPTLIAHDTVICRGASASLHVSGAQSYTWSPAAFLSCTNCANPLSAATSSTRYEVTGTSEHGCVSTDSVYVEVKVPFKLSVSNADSLCFGSSIQLTATGTDSYAWSPSTGLNNSSISSPLATPSTSITYQVTGTDSKGCFKDTAFIPIKVVPIPTVNAGADTTINVGQQVTINPQVSADVTDVLWTPTTGIVTNNYPGIIVMPPRSTDYTITVKNTAGCEASDKVSVFVLCNNANVFVPNTFSPNGDGVNDIFYPRGSGVFVIKNLKIFNRWGQVVFERSNVNANDVSAGWNGTFNGKNLLPDVFVYTLDVVCSNNSILVFKGNIALIK